MVINVNGLFLRNPKKSTLKQMQLDKFNIRFYFKEKGI